MDDVGFENLPPDYAFAAACEWCWRAIGDRSVLLGLKRRRIETPQKTLQFCDSQCMDLWREYKA